MNEVTDAAVQLVLKRATVNTTIPIMNPMIRRIYNGSALSFQRTDYSPLMLSNDWPRVARLAFVVFCACFGSIVNGFFVASFFVERKLRKIRNIFLACAGLSDLIITSAVMTVSAVVLMSGQWDNLLVCRSVEIVSETAIYSYSLFFLMVAIENFFRICCKSRQYSCFATQHVAFMCVFIYVFSFGLSVIGVYYQLDFDYCQLQHHGNDDFRKYTIVFFHVVPNIMSQVCFYSALIRVKSHWHKSVYYRRSELYEIEHSFTSLNLATHSLFIISWIPYLIVVHEYPNTSVAKYYYSVWLGLLRSVFTSFIYGIINSNFNRAFGYLFNYCFCKSTLSGSFTRRHRRALEYKPATGDVRVHIMHQAVSPGRNASSSRDIQEL